jgi:CheY-like chemotaxis protein
MLAMMDEEALDILFIEDDPDIAEMYRLKLELDGYWVRTVKSDSAVAAARAQCPEIVFLDLLSGCPERLTVLSAIRDAVRRPHLPSIILAASDKDELESQNRTLSASDYLVRVPTRDLPSTD